MKVFVTGVAGQLGYDVMLELKKRGHQAVGVDIAEMDITDEKAVTHGIKAENPDAVIHCAAWTAVDLAEDDDKKEKVYAVNVKGTEHIAKVCGEIGCKLLYLSTDYVFDGQGTIPWQPDDKCNPINYYGLTKYEGECAVERYVEKFFTVRIAWVFGLNGNNFIKTMLKLGKIKDALTVVDDQIGTPTYTYDLARLLVDMVETEKYGRYHATNEGGYISWYQFAKEIFKQAEKLGFSEYGEERLSVTPVESSAYPAKAKRPTNSRLDKSKLVDMGFTPLPVWQDALKRYLKEIEI